MPEALTYRCPFCDRDARVGKPCPGCAAKSAKKRSKPTSAVKKRKPKYWEPAASDSYEDDGFDYEDFCKREFGKSPHHRTGLRWYWWSLGVVVLAGMAAAAMWLR